MERKHPNLISPHIPIPRSPKYPSFHHPIKFGLLFPPKTSGSSLSRQSSEGNVKGRFPFLSLLLVFFLTFTYTALAQDSTVVEEIPDSLKYALTWDDNLMLKGELETTSIPQNDTLTFTATVQLSGNPMLYHLNDIEPPKVSNLDLISSATSNKTVVEDGIKNFYRVYTFNYIPKTMGMAYINPAALTVEFLPTGQKRLLRSTRLEIDVQEAVEHQQSNLILLILIPVALLFVGGGVYILFRKRGDQKVDIEPEIPIEQKYLDRLSETKQQLTKGDFPSFYEKAQIIIKDYIDAKWDIPAKSLSRDELIKRLDEAGLSTKILKELGESFATCDRIRFARESTDETEAHRVYSSFERLIQSFKPGETL